MYKTSNIYLILVLGLSQWSTADPPACCLPGEVMKLDENSTLGCSYTTSTKHTPTQFRCQKGIIPISLDEIAISYTADGNAIIENELNTIEIGNDSYCVDDLYDEESNQTSKFLLECVDAQEEESWTLPICMLISVFFYFLTAIIYATHSELRDLLGKCIINFCLAIGMGLFILSLMNIVPYPIEDITENGTCAARGFFVYFFLLVAFFWTNVISIHTLLCFLNCNANSNEFKTLIKYSIYAWGVPVVLTGIMAIVNFHPGDHEKPGIGLNTCWFSNSVQRWYYLYSVMTILIIINFCIFCYILFIIWKSPSYGRESTRHLRYKLSLTSKLCLLMGIPWIFEMISSKIENDVMRFALDFFTVLQGVLIFLVMVVLRKRALKAMNKRGWFCCLKPQMDRYLAVVNDDEAMVVETEVTQGELHHIK